jgi:hypothetical protein
VWWLEDEEIFVLILENKLVDKRVLLKAIEGFLELLHIEMATPIAQNLELSIGFLFLITEDIVTESKAFISKFISW